MRLDVVFVFFLVLRQDILEHRHYFPRKLDPNLLRLLRQFVYMYRISRYFTRIESILQRTVCSVLR